MLRDQRTPGCLADRVDAMGGAEAPPPTHPATAQPWIPPTWGNASAPTESHSEPTGPAEQRPGPTPTPDPAVPTAPPAMPDVPKRESRLRPAFGQRSKQTTQPAPEAPARVTDPTPTMAMPVPMVAAAATMQAPTMQAPTTATPASVTEAPAEVPAVVPAVEIPAVEVPVEITVAGTPAHEGPAVEIPATAPSVHAPAVETPAPAPAAPRTFRERMAAARGSRPAPAPASPLAPEPVTFVRPLRHALSTMPDPAEVRSRLSDHALGETPPAAALPMPSVEPALPPPAAPAGAGNAAGGSLRDRLLAGSGAAVPLPQSASIPGAAGPARPTEGVTDHAAVAAPIASPALPTARAVAGHNASTAEVTTGADTDSGIPDQRRRSTREKMGRRLRRATSAPEPTQPLPVLDLGATPADPDPGASTPRRRRA